MMKKAILVSMAALLVLAIPALADNDLGGQSSGQAAVMDTIGLLGKGMATLPSDPANFMVVSVGVAKVKVTVNETETTVLIGVLIVDDQKYRIKDVVIGNGTVSGNLYLNDTRAGSLDVKSVVKGETEIWAGTLILDGTSYNLHILQAPRAMKKSEWREKVRDYCSENPTDGNCSQGIESFCESNPTSVRCLALFKAHCMKGSNMDDSRCRQFMVGWCNDIPENTDCRLYAIQRSEKYCEDNPGTPTCNAIQKRLESFCETDTDNGKCRGFCQQNPEKCRSVVTNMADFCLENSNHTECLQYCRSNPRSCINLSSSLVSACGKEPNKEGCREYCKAHPAACMLATADLAKFCLTNQNETKCLNYCQNYPDACRKVTQNIESFCSSNSGKAVCQAVCGMSPQRCRMNQPVQAEIENEQNAESNSGSTQNTELNQEQNENQNNRSGQGGQWT